MKKLVAIGGGENGRLLDNGTYATYDTKKIDQEIIRLTNKEHPNFLFIGHAMKEESLEISYFNTMKKIYSSCICDNLLIKDLDSDITLKKLKWADIIYVSGGDTSFLIDLWQKKNFAKKLYNFWINGKLLCGISAGASCWFNSCNSDVLGKFKMVKCLNFINYHLTPHANEKGRKEATKKMLKNTNLKGILLPNKTALEIIDNKIKVIKEEDSLKVLKIYYLNNKYMEEEIK